MIQEKIVVGKGTKYPLDGILTLPDNVDGAVPAVVLVHGSGSSNMDEKVGKVTPFRDIAEGLAKQGIATLRYNKRSFSYGFKMIMDKNLTITVKEETIEDAVMASRLLKNDSRIDSNNIFIAGHSMGGMLAPRIDAEGGDFKGLVIMAGSPRRLEDIMKDQMQEMLGSMNSIVRKLSQKKIDKMLGDFEGLYSLTDEQAKRKKFGGGTTLYYFREMGEHSTERYLERCTKPMLILQGEKDFQAKADVDFEMYKSILKGRDNVTFRLYPNLNHVFADSVYGHISKAKQEYNVAQKVNDGVIKDIAQWIMTNCD